MRITLAASDHCVKANIQTEFPRLHDVYLEHIGPEKSNLTTLPIPLPPMSFLPYTPLSIHGIRLKWQT